MRIRRTLVTVLSLMMQWSNFSIAAQSITIHNTSQSVIAKEISNKCNRAREVARHRNHHNHDTRAKDGKQLNQEANQR